jgi:hypothetical protein
VPASGANILDGALRDLERYPTELSQQVRDWALSADAPPSTVGTTIRRWMEDNPIATSPIAKSREVAAASADDVVRSLDAEVKGGGRGGFMPSGEQPGQQSLGTDFAPESPLLPEGAGSFTPEMLLPDYVPKNEIEARKVAEIRAGIDAARAARIARGEPDVPTTGLQQTESPLGTETRAQPLLSEGEGTFTPEMLLPDYVPKSEIEAKRIAEIKAGIEDARARRAAAGVEDVPTTGLQESDLPGFRAPQLKLPVYVSKDVRDLLEAGNQSVSHATPVTDEFLADLAAKTGESADRLRKVWKPGEEGDAVLRSVSHAVDSAAQDLARAQETLKANPTSGDARAEMVRQLTRYQALQETAGARRPETAGVLSQLKDTTAGRRAADDQLEEMARRAHMGDDVDAYAKELAKVDLLDEYGRPDVDKIASFAKISRNYTFGDKLTALYYFSLLSNPLTHVRNVVGNTVAAGLTPVEQLGSAALDPLARKALGDKGPRQRYFGEAGAQLAGYKDAWENDALSAVTDSLKYGNPSKSGELGRMAHEPFAGTPLEALGYSGRALEAEDQVFGALNRRADFRAQAYRMASQEGLKGDAFTERVAKLLSAPDEDMLKAADNMADYRSFRQTDKATGAINALTKAWPALKGIVPFARVPINIAKYTLERSPLGAAKLAAEYATPGGRAALRRAGSGDLADRMSRAGIGSTIMYGLYKYADSGNLTGRAPDDPVERAQWEREGKTPYSFKTPAGWLSYDALQPYAALIGAAADIAEAEKRGKLAGKEADVGAIGTAAAFAMARGLVNTQFTQGLVDTLDLLQNKGTNTNLGELATRFAGQQLSSAVPGIVRGIARMTDDTIRDPDQEGWTGVLQRGMMNVPGLQDKVPESVGAFGETRRRPSSGLGAMVSPFTLSQPTDDPVEIELKRLQEEQVQGLPKRLGNYQVEPGFVSKNITIGDKVPLPVGLSDEEQRQYQRESGHMAYAILHGMVGTKEWDAMSDDEKAQTVDDIYTKSRSLAKKAMEPDLVPKAIEGLQRGLDERQRRREP